MKSLSLLVLLVVLGTGLFGQQATSSLDFVSGVDYTYRTLNTEHNDRTVVVEARDKNESPGVHFRVGFNYARKISKKFSLKTGVRYARVGYQLIQEDSLRWPSQHNNNGGFDPNLPGEGETLEINFQYTFLELPFVLRYHFNPESLNKMTTFLEAGVSPSVYLNTRHVSKLDNDRKVTAIQETQIEKIHWVAQISYGFNFMMKNSDAFFCQPVARFHINKTVNGVPINEHLYSFGLEFGYRKTLTR